jgi:hypothetical protein
MALMAERPEDEFKEQDRIFKHCQKIFKADKHEQNLLEIMQKETSTRYLSRRDKFKKQNKERQHVLEEDDDDDDEDSTSPFPTS